MNLNRRNVQWWTANEPANDTTPRGYRDAQPSADTAADASRERAQKLQGVAGAIYQSQTTHAIRESMVRNARLYGNLPMLGLSPRMYRQTITGSGGSFSRLSYNLVKSCCDSYVAQLVKDEPKVMFSTDGGDYSMMKRSKLLTKFVDGVTYDSDFDNTSMAIALDSAIFGVGWVQCLAWSDAHPDEEGEDKILLERVFPWEMFADEADAAYGKPRCIYRIKYVDRGWLLASYPDLVDQLETAGSAGLEESARATEETDVTDLVLVIEAWHLATTKKSNDGRHMMVVGDVALLDEPFEDDRFPFEALYRTRPLVGIVGQSLADDLSGVQREIMILLAKIQRSHHLLGAGHWLINRASKVNTNRFDNQIGSQILYDGIPPQFVAPDPVAAQIYAHLDRLIQYGYQMTGINQQTAMAQKPAGLDSGEAQRVYADSQTQRFTCNYREFQHFRLRIARQICNTARRIVKKSGDLGVKFNTGNVMREIKWSQINLDESDYVMKMFPTNKLASDLPGKISQVTDMMNTGMVDNNTARRIVGTDVSDIDSYNSLVDASYNLTAKIAEQILDEGKYTPPNLYMNLDESIVFMRNQLNKAMADGAPSESLDLLDTWINQAIDMQPKAPPAPAMAPPGAAPMGAPPPRTPVPQTMAA